MPNGKGSPPYVKRMRMAVLKRSRSLYFRVTDAEYEAVEKASARDGARSLSEFARRAVFETVDALSEARTIQHRLSRVDRALSAIRKEVKLLASDVADRP